jgi:hypothetical protein
VNKARYQQLCPSVSEESNSEPFSAPIADLQQGPLRLIPPNPQIGRQATATASGERTEKFRLYQLHQGETKLDEIDRRSRSYYTDVSHPTRGLSPFPFSNLLPIQNQPSTSVRTEDDAGEWGPYPLHIPVRVSVKSTNDVPEVASKLRSNRSSEPPVIPGDWLHMKASQSLDSFSTFDSLEQNEGPRGLAVDPVAIPRDSWLVTPLPSRVVDSPGALSNMSLGARTTESSLPPENSRCSVNVLFFCHDK